MVAFEITRWQKLVFALPFLLQFHNVLIWASQINKWILARAQCQWGFRAADSAKKNLEKLSIAICREEKRSVTNTKEEREFRKRMGTEIECEHLC